MNPSNTKLPPLKGSFTSPTHGGCTGKPHLGLASCSKTCQGRTPASPTPHTGGQEQKAQPTDGLDGSTASLEAMASACSFATGRAVAVARRHTKCRADQAVIAREEERTGCCLWVCGFSFSPLFLIAQPATGVEIREGEGNRIW